jgi:hypothetical protein
MLRARLTTDPDGRICVESPYDAGFVEALKRGIDYGGREWVPDRKRWLISVLYEPELLDILQTAGAQVTDDRAPATPPTAVMPQGPMPVELREAFETLYLAYTASLYVAEAVFRALAKVLHPDTGGNAEDFQRINWAITVIRRYLDPKPEDDTDVPF